MENYEGQTCTDRADDPADLFQLPRLFLFVLDVFAERATAEEPNGPLRERLGTRWTNSTASLIQEPASTALPEHDRLNPRVLRPHQRNRLPPGSPSSRRRSAIACAIPQVEPCLLA